MKKHIPILVLSMVLACSSCQKKNSMPEGVFEVVYLGTANPCTGLQIWFKKGDLSRLRPYLSTNEYHGDGRIGTLNLVGNYQAGDRVTVRVRQLRDDEHWICPALYEGLPVVYIVDDHPTQ